MPFDLDCLKHCVLHFQLEELASLLGEPVAQALCPGMALAHSPVLGFASSCTCIYMFRTISCFGI